MDNFLSKLDGRIRERQAELVELQTAKRVYLALNGDSQAQAAPASQSSSTDARQFVGQNQTITVAALKAA